MLAPACCKLLLSKHGGVTTLQWRQTYRLCGVLKHILALKESVSTLQLAGGLTCVLQNAVAGGSGPNCIMQLCHQQTNKDVLALFLLGLALCAVALLALLRVPWRIAAAAFRARRCAMTVSEPILLLH